MLWFFHEDGSFGLPESVAVFFEPHEGEGYALQWYADTESDVAVRITPGNARRRIRTVSVNGAPHRGDTETCMRLILPSRRVTRVLIGLT